jgi:hypothetical protein
LLLALQRHRDTNFEGGSHSKSVFGKVILWED